MLPSSKLWGFLEDHLPSPSDTYQKIAQLLEAEEAEHINKEIGKRRTRLGAFISQVTREVKLEVWAGSSLEEIYENIINWTRDDDMRREYEEKLLKRAYDTLTVLPLERKAEKRAKVHELAQGMVIIKHPYKLAWSIYLEWRDRESFAAFELPDFKQYIDFFPQDGLAKVLQGYVGSEISPAIPSSTENTASEANAEDNNSNVSFGDRLLLMTVRTSANFVIPPS
jgi:superkiller protein 3